MDKEKFANEIDTLADQIKDSKGPIHRAWIKLRKAAALVRASKSQDERPAKGSRELKT